MNGRFLGIGRRGWRLGLRDFCTKVSSVAKVSPSKPPTVNAISEGKDESAPKYPPLFNPSRLGRQRYERQKWYDRIRALPTVEEKLLEISRGFFGRDERQRLCILKAFTDRYSTLSLRQNCTFTHLIHGLPPNAEYDDDPYVNAITERVKPAVLDAIRHCFSGSAPLEPHVIESENINLAVADRLNGQRMIDHVLRAISLTAGDEHGRHLSQCQMDVKPRSEAYWIKGDFPPDLNLQAARKSLLKKFPDRLQPKDPVDIWFQYIGHPYLQIRSKFPMPEFVGRNDPLCTAIQVPEFPYEPRTIGYNYEKRFATMVPGVWPSDPFRFGLLSFHTRQQALRNERCFGKESIQEALHGLGVISSFGWLAALATNNGFTPFHELTYPMTTQTVITNGRQWSFYAYQLNTFAFGMDFDLPVDPMEVRKDKLQNICWATDESSLFEAVDQDGHVIGFNDSVLKTIVGFVLRKPLDQVNFELQPHLSRSANHTYENWANIVKEVRHRYANKPLSTRIRETPLYEKIYKIKFKTRID